MKVGPLINLAHRTAARYMGGVVRYTPYRGRPRDVEGNVSRRRVTEVDEQTGQSRVIEYLDFATVRDPDIGIDKPSAHDKLCDGEDPRPYVFSGEMSHTKGDVWTFRFWRIVPVTESPE